MTGIAPGQKGEQMRLIDGDALVEKLDFAIEMLRQMMKALDAEDDPELRMELKAYVDIRDGVKDEPEIKPEP